MAQWLKDFFVFEILCQITLGKIFYKIDQGTNESDFYVCNKCDLFLFLFCLYFFCFKDSIWKLGSLRKGMIWNEVVT